MSPGGAPEPPLSSRYTAYAGLQMLDHRHFCASLLTVLALTAVGLRLAADAPRPSASEPILSEPPHGEASTPGYRLPAVREHRYRMAGKIRPFLAFWIGRERVGLGRIVWRQGNDGTRAYELLIGSDPAVAPRRLNRWGYFAEEVRGGSAALLGIISDADREQSIDAVNAALHDQEHQSFKTIRATVTPLGSRVQLSRLRTSRDMTFRDVRAVLTLLSDQPAATAVETVAMPAGTRPGFLTAVAEKIHASVQEVRGPGHHAADPCALVTPYVYGDKFYDLRLRSHRLLDSLELEGRVYGRVLRADFETRERRTGDKARFRLVYGTEGELAEVPIKIAYQPRWWLKVELLLEDAPTREPLP